VAALGASSYTFAYATPRETMADWLEGCVQALNLGSLQETTGTSHVVKCGRRGFP
jgi:hypothetical protein